jgi:trimeric autotransporter adhesin
MEAVNQNSRMRIARLLSCICLFAATAALAQTSVFTYQGRLNDKNGAPANGSYDFMFRLLNDPTNGVAAPVIPVNLGVLVSNGLFTTSMDFGAENLDGTNLWLEISVRTNGGGAFATLMPRQLLASTPYAVRSANAAVATVATTALAANSASSVAAANVSGTLSLGQLPGAIVTNKATGVTLTGTFGGNGANITNVNAATLNGFDANRFWQLGGNNVTNGQFIGTTNNQPLEFWANGLRVLRIDPLIADINNVDEPNILAGSSQNSISNAYGVTISGGGTMTYQGLVGPYPNVAAPGADFSTIGGGFSNNVNGAFATIGGGARNVASGIGSVVGGGGTWNLGQSGNKATGDFSAIGGGIGNQATNTGATVPGGAGNIAGGQYSFAAGRQAKATNNGAFVWADSQPAEFFSSANNEFAVRAAGGVHLKTFGAGMTIDGQTVLTTGTSNVGFSIQQTAAGAPNIILGASNNFVATGIVGATISGGGEPGWGTNSVTGVFGTVGGGANNSADGYGTVAGGWNNTANGGFATIGGGQYNKALSGDTTIAGGQEGSATAAYATVGGGYRNVASGYGSTVVGGWSNEATNLEATVAGGNGNLAGGAYSFAAGQRAKALHDGSFVWADSQGSDLSSTANDQFLIRAQGGLGINTTTIREGSVMINTNVYVNDHPIYLRGSLAADHNHGLAYNGNGVTNFTGNYQVDGPVLWGFGGGVLGTRSGGDFGALSWSRSTTIVSGTGTSSGGVSGFNEVVAQFTNTSAAHNAISVEASAGHDAILYFAEGGSAKWGLRENHNDDSFNIRWHGNGANTTLVSVQGTNGNMTVAGTVTANGVQLTSDRNAKENFAPVDSKTVLEKVASLPLTQWNYKKEDATQKHMGPMAQDFHSAFGLNGDDDRHISSVDEAGVALAAIQGLNDKLKEKDNEIADLKQSVAELQKAINQLQTARK